MRQERNTKFGSVVEQASCFILHRQSLFQALTKAMYNQYNG